MINRVARYIRILWAIGLVKTTQFYLYKALGIRKMMYIGPHRTIVRPFDSDMDVYRQVFHAREYDVGKLRADQIRKDMENIRRKGRTPVIIDGGANVGYSPIFFAETYPDAIVIAVEPDEKTYEILRQNCAGFPNVRPVRGAIWSHDNGVNLENPEDVSWARRVTDGGATPSFTIETLLSTVPDASLVVLKLDIEGAEAEVVSHSAATIRDCPCILIEPHDWLFPDRNSMAPFFKLLADRQIDTLIRGENLMFFDTRHLNSLA